MKLAMIGLGKMGANMATRLLRGGHNIVGYDLNEVNVKGYYFGDYPHLKQNAIEIAP